MNIPVVAHHHDVFVAVVGSDGKTSRQIRRRPICFGEGAGPRPLSEGRVNRGKGGGRAVEEALWIEDRQVGGGTLRVEAMFCRRVFRWPKAVARDRGGNLRTSLVVSRGIPWIYPRERARRKVEIDGEPKQRCK